MIFLDGVTITEYPLKTQSGLYTNFYHKFLQQTNSIQNPLSSGLISREQFENGNFFIVENLKKKNLFSGQLTAAIKFKNMLLTKLYFLMIPIYQKQLVFDEALNVSVSDMHPVLAEKSQQAADKE